MILEQLYIDGFVKKKPFSNTVPFPRHWALAVL